MKKLILLSLIFINFKFCQAQKSENGQQLFGIWMFVPPEKGYDSSFVIFNNKNKSIDIFYWLDTKSANIVLGTPFTYYGFWDTYIKEPQPKKISDLKVTGKYIYFYDDLIKNDDSKIKIGFDSLGKLYEPTRRCEWTINDGLPEGLSPQTLTLHFNMTPDVYKKVDTIPDYVLISLKKNKEDWKKYLDFIGDKELMIKQLKSYIHSLPNKNKATKMYLLKNDEVEILEEKDQWIKIRYYGKKTIEGWIKKSDVTEK